MIDLTSAFREVLTTLKVKYTEKGNRLECRCPFHDDNTPSSGVYKSTGKFYCFSCDLTLDAAQFLAKATGEDTDKAAKDLEEKFGVFQIPRDKDKELRITKERAKAETRLLQLRNSGISGKGYGSASELFDRFIFLYEQKAITDLELDSNLAIWYNSSIDDIEKFNDAEIHPKQDRATGTDLNGRFSFGSANLSRDGKEGVRSSLEGAQSSLPNRVREVSNAGSDTIELD